MVYDLAADVAAKTGQSVDADWLVQVSGEAMAAVRAVAPCRADEWLTTDDLPEDVYRVVVASIARRSANPWEARHQTIGEFSVTLDAGTASGGFTEMELLVIRRVSGCEGTSAGRVYTVRMAASAPLKPDVTDGLSAS